MSKNLEIIAPAALVAQKATGCPGLLLIAQCALETGWLKSAPGNNCFGIKEYAGCFGRQLLPTNEWFTDAELARWLAGEEGRTAELIHPIQVDKKGRHKYAARDWFATFPTLGDCFAKRAAMWDEGPYAGPANTFKSSGNLSLFVREIAPIYATDPNYFKSVMSIINQADVQAAWKAAQV